MYTHQAFKQNLHKLSAICQRNGIFHHYFGGEGDFVSLSAAEKILCVTGLNQYAGILEYLESHKLDFTNSTHLLKAVLEKLKLKLPDGLFERIIPSDFVEIYTKDLVPLFKTPNFWGTSSYPLDQLYTNPYNKLYERSEFNQAQINRGISRILKRVVPILEKPVSRHIAWETKGLDKVWMEIKLFAQVLDEEGDVVALISVSDITPIRE